MFELCVKTDNGFFFTCTRCRMAAARVIKHFYEHTAPGLVRLGWRPDPGVERGWICRKCNDLEFGPRPHRRAAAPLPASVCAEELAPCKGDPVITG